MNLLTKFRGDSAALPPRAPAKAAALAFIGGFLAIAIIALLAQSLHLALVLVVWSELCARFWLSRCAVQPAEERRARASAQHAHRSCVCAFVRRALVECGAGGSAIAVMMLTRTVHPPAGRTR